MSANEAGKPISRDNFRSPALIPVAREDGLAVWHRHRTPMEAVMPALLAPRWILATLPILTELPSEPLTAAAAVHCSTPRRARRCIAAGGRGGTRAILTSRRLLDSWLGGGNRSEFPQRPTRSSRSFTRKWNRELDYRALTVDLAFGGHRRRVRFAYEFQ